mmetsp:Transcript_44601/g.74413  ORF Transcript_44601/g.74413 Transcript_44601/m.74413 type:complete len:190 (+) Transcript_44601:1392-1961(+)
MLYCANMRGDSDSVCAVVGQLAGAIYGLEAIPKAWIKAVEQWDGGGSIALRAYKLYKAAAAAAAAAKEAGPSSSPRDAVKAGSKREVKGQKGDVASSGGAEEEGKASKKKMEVDDAGAGCINDISSSGDTGGYAPALHSCVHAITNIAKINPSEAKLLYQDLKCQKCGHCEEKDLWVCMGTTTKLQSID